MARKGDQVTGHTSVEVFYNGTADEYKELVIRATFQVNDEGSAGYFNHITGDAEPPSGPELEMEELEIARGDNTIHNELHQLSWTTIELHTLQEVLGDDWMKAVLVECEQHAVERM